MVPVYRIEGKVMNKDRLEDNRKTRLDCSEENIKDDRLKLVVRYLGDAFVEAGSFVTQVAGLLSDCTREYRYRNFMRVLDNVSDIHRRRKLEGKPIPLPPKYMIPILNHASLEDDPKLVDLWSGLIANATDPNVGFNVNKLYIEILSGLDSIDVQIIEFLSRDMVDTDYDIGSVYRLNAEEISKKTERLCDDIKISLGNLFRNGLLIDSWENSIDRLDEGYAGLRVNNPKSNFRLSHLGSALWRGCSID